MESPTAQEILSHFPREKRLLGLDIGEKTIGLALSDALRSIASPYMTIARGKWQKDVAELKRVIEKENVGGLVLGYPVNMDGSEGSRCQSVRQFAKNIDTQLGLPAFLWDERMSTMAVERIMLEADISRAKRAEHVDKLAATYILQGFLDSLAKVR